MRNVTVKKVTFLDQTKPEKNKNTVDIESGTGYTYSVIQIKTCYLI